MYFHPMVQPAIEDDARIGIAPVECGRSSAGSEHGSRARRLREPNGSWRNDVLVFPASGRPVAAAHGVKDPPLSHWEEIRPMQRML